MISNDMACITARDGSSMWKISNDGVGVLYVITDEAFYEVQQPTVTLDHLLEELLIEGVPADIRLDNEKKIPHKKLIAIKGNEKTYELTITHNSFSIGAAIATHGMQTFESTLPDIIMFREMLDSYKNHLGNKANIKRKEHTPLMATLPSVGISCLVAFMTWALASGFLLDQGPTTGKNGIFKAVWVKLAEILGPVGVIAIGMACLIACAVYGYRCYKNPPITVTVKF